MTEPTTRPESHTKAMLRHLIEPHVIYLHRATQPFGPELNVHQLLASLYAGVGVYLLAHLAEHAPEHVVEELVADLEELMDGEGLSEWVADEATRRGIDIDAIVEAAEVRRIANETKGASRGHE